MSEEKKVVAPVELSEEELEFVDGGAYTADQWNSLSASERIAALMRSKKDRAANKVCELD